MSEEKELRELWIDEESRVVTIRLHGYNVQCLPELGRVVASQEATSKTIPVPTYSYEDAITEETITREFDQEGIDDPKTSEEDRATWAAYQAAVAKASEDQGEQLMRELALKCIIVPDMPHTDEEWAEWIEERQFLRPDDDMPTSSLLRKHKWIRAEVLITPFDITCVIEGITKAHGASEEVLRQLEASFRSAMGQEEDDAGADESEDAQRSVEQDGDGSSTDLHGGDGEEIGGDSTEAVA